MADEDYFSLYRAPGPPGEYFGYLRIKGVAYKLRGHASGKRKGWRVFGTVNRDVKADQRSINFDDPESVPF
jgi:hypothetical protein